MEILISCGTVVCVCGAVGMMTIWIKRVVKDFRWKFKFFNYFCTYRFVIVIQNNEETFFYILKSVLQLKHAFYFPLYEVQGSTVVAKNFRKNAG